MYRLSVEADFAAAHAISVAGVREPLHGHHWHVTAEIEGDSLDADGLLVDFHAVESALRTITGRFHNRNLNETPPFDRENPTAELVARYIGEALSAALSGRLPPGVRLSRVSVSEAIGCVATYGVGSDRRTSPPSATGR